MGGIDQSSLAPEFRSIVGHASRARAAICRRTQEILSETLNGTVPREEGLRLLSAQPEYGTLPGESA